jgi:hypothetical protein
MGITYLALPPPIIQSLLSLSFTFWSLTSFFISNLFFLYLLLSGRSLLSSSSISSFFIFYFPSNSFPTIHTIQGTSKIPWKVSNSSKQPCDYDSESVAEHPEGDSYFVRTYEQTNIQVEDEHKQLTAKQSEKCGFKYDPMVRNFTRDPKKCHFINSEDRSFENDWVKLVTGRLYELQETHCSYERF